MREHAAFYLTTIKHPGQWSRDFRAAESKGASLSSFNSTFQSVCLIVQLWVPGICWVYTRTHHNCFSPTSTNPQKEQNLYLRNFILRWTMQNKVALKLNPLHHPDLFGTQNSLHITRSLQNVTRENRRMLPTRKKGEGNKASPHC